MDFNRITIDSMKIRIPLNICGIEDAQLFDRWIMVNENELKEGSLVYDDSVFKDKALRRSQHGITTRFAIERVTDTNQETEEYVTMLVNSKMLEENYLNGINRNNIKTIYKRLQEYNIVSFTYRHFMEATACTDIDFKTDIENPNFKAHFQHIISMAKSSKLAKKGYRHFTSKDNKGISFGDRRLATKSNPFIKIYHKTLELQKNSKEFYQKFIAPLEVYSMPDHLIRCEFTLKNKKHLQHYGIMDNSLKTILSYSDFYLKGIQADILAIHLKSIEKPLKRAKDNLTPDQQIIFNALQLIDRNQDVFTITSKELLQGIDNKASKSRKKKMLDTLYYDYLHSDNEFIREENEKATEFFEFIGWIPTMDKLKYRNKVKRKSKIMFNHKTPTS